MKLNEDRLAYLVRHYTRVRIAPASSELVPMERELIGAGLMEIVTRRVVSKNADGSIDAGPRRVLVLSEKAKELVRSHAGLRLVTELLSRAHPAFSTPDLGKIVARVPFRALPLLLACGDSSIRDLAARRIRKREFLRRI